MVDLLTINYMEYGKFTMNYGKFTMNYGKSKIIVDFPMKNGGSFQFVMLNYQRVTVCELENGPVEIVDLPSYIAWWICPIRFFVNVYQ